ncbi:MAG: DUF6932 family protein [Saprospiraceae bacterium]
MLQFNPKGLLTPASLIRADMASMRKALVEDIGTLNRTELFRNLLIFCRQFFFATGCASLKIWVNGSFATNKPEPGDLDLLVFIEHGLFGLHENTIREQFNRATYAQDLRLDLYFLIEFPENHAKHPFTVSDKAYWMHQFTQTRPNRRGIKEQKGFLELNLTHDEISQI